VQQGLQRIRAGKTWPGIAALMKVAGRDPAKASTYDLGFVLGRGSMPPAGSTTWRSALNA